MVSQQIVQQQLHALGVGHRFFGNAELHELKNILVPQETMQVLANGLYDGGFATIVVTDKRILIVDKKPFVLNIEDMRYDMVTEVSYESRLLDAQIRINLPHKMVHFRSWHQQRLREVSGYIQERVMESHSDWLHRQRLTEGAVAEVQPILPPINAIPTEVNVSPPRVHRFRPRRSAQNVHSTVSRLAIKETGHSTPFGPG